MSTAYKSPRTRMTYAQSGNATLPDFSYTFDAASNILTKKFEHRSGTPSEDYLYDTLYRLTRTDFGQRTSTPYESFVYDDLGNHLTQNNNGTEIAGLFNSANEQTKRGGVDVLYDKKGNLTKDDTSGGGQVYFYDRQNLLTRVEKPANTLVASYSYDAFNRRIEKDVNGGDVTCFYYTADWRLLEETDDAGTPAVQRYYVWGNYIDELLMFRDVSGTGGSANADYFAARDHLYGVAALIDTSGAVVERYEYDAYGKPHFMDASYSSRSSSTYGNNILFDGYYYDVESGLYCVRNRIYDPVTMRWSQRDPRRYVDGINQYQYVGSNAIIYRDPLGLALRGTITTGPTVYRPCSLGGCKIRLERQCNVAECDGDQPTYYSTVYGNCVWFKSNAGLPGPCPTPTLPPIECCHFRNNPTMGNCVECCIASSSGVAGAIIGGAGTVIGGAGIQQACVLACQDGNFRWP